MISKIQPVVSEEAQEEETGHISAITIVVGHSAMLPR